MELNPSSHRERLGSAVDWVFGRRATPAREGTRNASEPFELDLRTEIAWAKRLHRVATDLPLTQPPALLRQRLRQQFRGWAAGQRLPAAPALELGAWLVFDSRQDQLAVGVRGHQHDPENTHLVWRAEVAELIVQARTQSDGLVRLDGQVLLTHPTASPVFEIQAHGPGVSVTVVDGDDLGRFQAIVPHTVNRLHVSNGEVAMSATLSLDPP